MLDHDRIPGIIQPDFIHPPPLATGKIHLYILSANDLPIDDALLDSYLNKEELVRADRFINPLHGRTFRRVRGMLRFLLAEYLDIAPRSLEFDYAEYGKPSLRGRAAVQFNLSHSHDMAAYAFRRDRELGVDIEYMRPQKDLAGMMRHVGSTKEQAELSGLSEADAHEAFYRLWTRKEAFIKACGRGLGMGLNSVHIGSAETNLPLAIAYKDQIMPQWFVQDVELSQGYKVAVCSKMCDAK